MITLVGVSHRSAPLEVRERLAMSEADVRALLARIRDDGSPDEAFVLSTCNRVEFLVRATTAEGGERLEALLHETFALDRETLDRYAYRLGGRDAVRHVFRVASGLDSMILGEPQIQGQMKSAFRVAREVGTTGVVLDRMLQHALSASKRTRAETGISRHAVSVAYAAVSLANKIFGDLDGRRVLMLGAGKMGELVARHLRNHGVGDLIVASRVFDNADRAARRFGGRAVHWEDGLEALREVDIVVSCTGAPQPVVRREAVAKAVHRRRSGPLFLIDIAVPRDIEPTVHELDNVYLYDIDALEGVVDGNLAERRRAARQAETLIEEEVDAFNRWRQAQGIAPLIRLLRGALFEIGDRELERLRRKMGELDERQDAALNEYSRTLVRKFLHAPTRHLREAANRGEAEHVGRLLVRLFDLHPGKAGDEEEEDETPRSGPQRLLRGGKDEG